MMVRSLTPALLILPILEFRRVSVMSFAIEQNKGNLAREGFRIGEMLKNHFDRHRCRRSYRISVSPRADGGEADGAGFPLVRHPPAGSVAGCQKLRPGCYT